MPITTDQVRAWLRLQGVDDSDLTDATTAATNAYVARNSPLAQAADTADPPVDWPDDVIQGAVMYGARLYRRRNSPQGMESAGDQVLFTPRYDADITRLLGLTRPMVG